MIAGALPFHFRHPHAPPSHQIPYVVRRLGKPTAAARVEPAPAVSEVLAVDGKSMSLAGDGTAPKVFDYSEIEPRSFRDYIQQSRELIRPDGGPPRWFSPLECGARGKDSPLLLYLPGIDGTGAGLIRHHQRLGKIFDVWCLHIPVMDRTPFEGTSFFNSQLHSLSTLLKVVPEPLHVTNPYFLSFITGDLMKMAVDFVEIERSIQQAFWGLQGSLGDMLHDLTFMTDILPKESLLWRLKMLESASFLVNSHIHVVKAQTLILASGRDQFLPSRDEAERLCSLLPNCRIRHFKESGHTIFLEGAMDLVTTIKGAGYYRRSRQVDYVSDYLLPTPSELQKIAEEYRWVDLAANPVMLSTLENGRIIKGLMGIPSEGPVLFVGYHMLLGLELAPMVLRFLDERQIHLRGIAHPFLFNRSSELLIQDSSSFDGHRLLGAVPVSAANFYKLLSTKSFVLLYPGGAREALHRKGEEYKLFWPEQPEFVRMASRFGATIIPFGVVGEDDLYEVLLDYDDLIKIPFYDILDKRINDGAVNLRADSIEEVGKQNLHLPALLPKIPGRFYYLFGKPIKTRGRRKELEDREQAQRLYMHVKSEVESCIAYLKEKRERDPYRRLFPRLLYQLTHGLTAQVPTFEL